MVAPRRRGVNRGNFLVALRAGHLLTFVCMRGEPANAGVLPEPAPERWVPLLALFTAASLVDAAFYGQVLAFTPLHLASLGLTPEQVTRDTGLLSALTWGVGIPFLPLWGALADRYSRKPVIVRSYAAFLVAGLIIIIGRDALVFSLGRAVTAFALGNSGLMMTTLAERVPKRRLGLAFAVMNSAAPIGYFAGPLAGGPVVDAWGFRGLLAINLVAIALVIVGLAFGYRDTYRGTARGPLLRMAVDSVTLISREPALRALFVALFAMFIGWQVVIPYIPLAATSIYHGTDPGSAVGFVVGIGGLAVVFIGPALGAVGDRLGRRRTLVAGAAVAAVLLPLPMFAGSLGSLAVEWGAANGMLGAVFALSFTVLSDASTAETRGRVMSFAYLPTNASAVVGAAIGSAVAGYGVRWVFPAGAVLAAAGILVLMWAARQARRV
jgi:DHA1 family multidrug resistance protein-like MFS transporter